MRWSYLSLLALLACGSAYAENWYEEWKPEKVGLHHELGNFNGRNGVFLTHPITEAEPFRWQRSLAIKAGMVLHFEVSSRQDDYATNDWVLSVFADQQRLLPDTVVHGTNWQAFDVPLDALAGKTVTLKLLNANGGAASWHWENGYWDAVRIDQKAPPEKKPKKAAGGSTRRW